METIYILSTLAGVAFIVYLAVKNRFTNGANDAING